MGKKTPTKKAPSAVTVKTNKPVTVDDVSALLKKDKAQLIKICNADKSISDDDLFAVATSKVRYGLI